MPNITYFNKNFLKVKIDKRKPKKRVKFNNDTLYISLQKINQGKIRLQPYVLLPQIQPLYAGCLTYAIRNKLTAGIRL